MAINGASGLTNSPQKRSTLRGCHAAEHGHEIYGSTASDESPIHCPADFVNINWTHTFSPRLLNQAGASVVRPQGAFKPVPALQIPYINVNGASGFAGWGPGNFVQTTVGWRDVMTAIIGRHTLKFGADFMNTRENDQQSGAFGRPTYNFNSLLDFMPGGAVSESATPVNLISHQQASYDRRYRELYQGFFVKNAGRVEFEVHVGCRPSIRRDG